MQINLQELPDEIVQAKQRYGIVGNAPGLLAAVSRAIQVAPIDLSVLVTGESGTGKEFFPKIIHGFSPRKHNKYIAVNCGAIPRVRLIRNFSVMRKARLPVRYLREKDISRRPMAALYFSTKWRSCLSPLRRDC